jgi:cytolysin-activating lysine-acyltransferase
MTGDAPDPRPLGLDGAKALDPAEFGQFLGIASWLMSMSKDHRDLPISSLDARVLPAILLKQFKIYQKGKMPIAFVSWALVSDAVQAQLARDAHYVMQPTDWRSGPHLVIVECVSPFAAAAEIRQQFLNSAKKSA